MQEYFELDDPRIPPGAEVLIGHGKIIPGPYQQVLEDGALHIKGNKILAVAPTKELRTSKRDIPFINAKGHVILPGLFNSHTHVAMGFFRGLGHGQENMIESFLFPAEKNLTLDLLKPLSYSYIVDGIRGGVTSFVDHYYFSEGVGHAFDQIGSRAWIGETIADLGGAFPGEECWDRAMKLIDQHPFSSRIRHAIAPHAADTVSTKLLKKCADFAVQQKLPLHMHLAQTSGEVERVQKREKVSPVEIAHHAGALFENSLVVHMTNVTKTDLELVQKSGATLGYCPSSTTIYDKLADIQSMQALNIPMALGTDCAASHDMADMLCELRIAGLMGRSKNLPEEAVSPDALLAMATTIPAKVLGVSHLLGTLEPGKLADLIILKESVSSAPHPRALVNVIWSMGSRDLTHVMVDGSWVLWNSKLSRVHEKDLYSEYTNAVSEIKNRTRLQG